MNLSTWDHQPCLNCLEVVTTGRTGRMTDLVEGTVSHEHKFDGCMYGLKSQFQETSQTNQETLEDCCMGGVFSEAS